MNLEMSLILVVLIYISSHVYERSFSLTPWRALALTFLFNSYHQWGVVSISLFWLNLLDNCDMIIVLCHLLINICLNIFHIFNGATCLFSAEFGRPLYSPNIKYQQLIKCKNCKCFLWFLYILFCFLCSKSILKFSVPQIFFISLCFLWFGGSIQKSIAHFHVLRNFCSFSLSRFTVSGLHLSL